MSKKVIDLREAVSFEGLVALGVDTIKNESVQVPLQFVKQGADSALAAAQSAVAATQAAATATSTANTATTAANTAAGLATTAAQMANIEALAQAAVKAAEDANTATVNADTATKAANTATNAANTAVGAIDDKIAPKLNTPTTNAASTAAIRNLVGQTSTGTPVRVSPSQLRELVGVDHSILTEQIVPGEFFIDRAGARKQVYVKTLRGTYPTEQPQYNVVELIAPTDHPSLLLSIQAAVILDNEIMWCINAGDFSVGKHGGLSQYFNTPTWLGKEYIITIKYTKR